MRFTDSLGMVLKEEWRLLTFRPVGEAIYIHWKAFLAFGLMFTWIAGVGRYWDNPKAHWWQYAGLGSVVYVFVLAMIIWVLLAPFRPRDWTYGNVLLFVTLTSPPAVLYAIPVERFTPTDVAVAANAWFLAVVAAWRVGLYAIFLRRFAGLSWGSVVVGTLLPLAIIVVVLTALNLEHVVFNLMGGIREENRSPNDGAYRVVFTLSLFSVLTAPFLAIAYVVLAFRARKARFSSPLPRSRPTARG